MVFKWRDNYTDAFLNLYRSYEFLWDNSNPLYKNRVARENAYKEIIQNLNLPNLSVRDVRNKIKTIRTNYKYELNKILRSQKDAVNSSDVYTPHLFWFKKADEFLRDFSMGREFDNSKMDFSEDEASCNQSDDNLQYQPDLGGLEIKLEEQPTEEEPPNINSDHSRSPSPPPVEYPSYREEHMTTTSPNSNSIENQPIQNMAIRRSPTSTNGAYSPHEFKAPATHKVNGRQFRKYNPINSIPKPRISPMYGTRQFLQLEERISGLQKSVDSLQSEKDDEFDLFGKSIALQLKKMPLERALICQENLQRVINQERLNQNKINGFGS